MIGAARVLTFGACLPLSGAHAYEGGQIKLGYEYWVRRANGSEPLVVRGRRHPVRVIILNNESVDRETGDLTEELIDKHGVDFLLGTYPTVANLHAADVADRRGVPYVTATGAGRAAYARGNRLGNVFALLAPARSYMAGTIELAVQQEPEPSTVVVLSCDDPAALEDATEAAALARSRGLEVLALAGDETVICREDGVTVYPHLRSSFRATAGELARLDPDVLIAAGHLVECAGLVREAARVRLKPRCFALSVGPSLPGFIERLAREGISVANLLEPKQWSAGLSTRGAAEFVGSFRQATGGYPTSFSAGAVACEAVYAESLRRAASHRRSRVRRSLSTITGARGLDTFFGRVEFDEGTGMNTAKPILTVQMRPGRARTREVVVWPPEAGQPGRLVWPFPGWGGQ